MKLVRVVLVSGIFLAASALARAQATTVSLLDLTTNTVISNIQVGDDPQSVAWFGNNVAYVVTDTSSLLARLDMTTSPPTITATFTFTNFGPHAIAVNPAGTRALVAGGGSSLFLMNLTTNPFSIADTIPAPDAGGIAFYANGSKAIVASESNVLILNLTTVPAGITTVPLSGGNQAHAVAVNAAGTRAAVSLDETGGMQTIDLTTTPPSLLGGVVGPVPGDPHGISVSPDGTRVIYVDEELPPTPSAEQTGSGGRINVINVSGSPAFVNSVPMSVLSPSAVAFNPVTGAALIAGDDGVAVLNPPYTAVNATIIHPGRRGASAYGLAVNPAGTRALVIHEDPFFCVYPLAIGNVTVGTTSAPVIETCTNSSVAPLTINSISVTGGTGFAQSGAPTLPLTIAAGASIGLFNVTFNPGTTGLQTGDVNVQATLADSSTFGASTTATGTGVALGVPNTCTSNPTTLCLSSGRFTVRAHWATSDGRSGEGQAVYLTGDTGYFWFFTSSNVEMIVKVLNACGFAQRIWVFGGGLTNVQVDLTVTDALTGTVKTYRNPQSAAFQPIQDTAAFATCSALLSPRASEERAEPPLPLRLKKTTLSPGPFQASFVPERSSIAPCTADTISLCLSSGRFLVRAHWATSDGRSGDGLAVSLSGDTGYFWFFSANNVEMVVKVLNACSFTPRIWVFAGGLTNVRVDLTVTDTQTGVVKTYQNPQTTAFQPIQDTSAFATCP